MDHFCVCVVLAMFSVLSSSILFGPYLSILSFVLCEIQVKKEPGKKGQIMPLRSHADASCASWLPQERSFWTKPARSGKCPAAVNASERLPGLWRRQRWSWVPLPTWSTWHLVRDWVMSGRRQTTPPLHDANLSQRHHVDMLPQHPPQIGTICSYTLDS
jgi:hypothetical protein